MNAYIRTYILAAAIAGVSATGTAWAHGAQDAGMNIVTAAAIVYNDTAYAQNQSRPPQAVNAGGAATARVVYVDKAYGQAIYSYPGRVEDRQAIEDCAASRWVVQ